MQTYVNLYACACIHSQICVYNVYVCASVYAHICTCTDSHTYIYYIWLYVTHNMYMSYIIVYLTQLILHIL